MQELKAPTGKFRVVGVDTFEGPTADYPLGDFDDLADAVKQAKEHSGTMNPCYVYDDKGGLRWHGGSF